MTQTRKNICKKWLWVQKCYLFPVLDLSNCPHVTFLVKHWHRLEMLIWNVWKFKDSFFTVSTGQFLLALGMWSPGILLNVQPRTECLSRQKKRKWYYCCVSGTLCYTHHPQNWRKNLSAKDRRQEGHKRSRVKQKINISERTRSTQYLLRDWHKKWKWGISVVIIVNIK